VWPGMATQRQGGQRSLPGGIANLTKERCSSSSIEQAVVGSMMWDLDELYALRRKGNMNGFVDVPVFGHTVSSQDKANLSERKCENERVIVLVIGIPTLIAQRGRPEHIDSHRAQ